MSFLVSAGIFNVSLPHQGAFTSKLPRSKDSHDGPVGNVSNPHTRQAFLSYVFCSGGQKSATRGKSQASLGREEARACVWWQSWVGSHFALQPFSSGMRLAGSSQAESKGHSLPQRQHPEAR